MPLNPDDLLACPLAEHDQTHDVRTVGDFLIQVLRNVLSQGPGLDPQDPLRVNPSVDWRDPIYLALVLGGHVRGRAENLVTRGNEAAVPTLVQLDTNNARAIVQFCIDAIERRVHAAPAAQGRLI